MSDEHNESENQMIEEPKETNWFSFSLSDFEYDTSADWNGFQFDDEFNATDNGQLQRKQIILDEADLLKRMRDESTRDTKVLPSTLFEFYDNCKNHFHLEFMALLKALISNVETAKKLEEKSKAGNLLNFYKFELSSKLNFGKHQICQDAAAKCNARLEQLIRDFGTSLQVETQIARECTAAELRNQLKACSADFLDFGEREWVKQCNKTSQYNILDQHFVVKGQNIETPTRTSDDEDDDEGDDDALELKDTPRSKPDIPKFQFFTISTYLYAAAINDSKKLVDMDIRKRRAHITAAKEKAAKEKALQREVDIRADAIKPSDAVMTLGRRFAAINARLDELQESTAQTTNVGDDDADVEERLAALEERLRALESSDPAAKLHPSKNEKPADAAKTQQSANARRRAVKKRRAEEAASETSSTTPAHTTPRTTTSGSHQPRPATLNNVNGQGKASKKQDVGPPGGQEKRGRDQSNDGARRPQHERQRPHSAERQSGKPRFQRGHGSGRGPGQGPTRA